MPSEHILASPALGQKQVFSESPPFKLADLGHSVGLEI